jgi:hypothetical protein
MVLLNDISSASYVVRATSPKFGLHAGNIKFSTRNGDYTGYSQKNGAVSKVNKKSISHLTRVKRTASAAATVQVSHVIRAVRFSCLLRGRGVSF